MAQTYVGIALFNQSCDKVELVVLEHNGSIRSPYAQFFDNSLRHCLIGRAVSFFPIFLCLLCKHRVHERIKQFMLREPEHLIANSIIISAIGLLWNAEEA